MPNKNDVERVERWSDGTSQLGEVFRSLPPAESLTTAELASVRRRLAGSALARPRRWATRELLLAFAVLVGGSTAFAGLAAPGWKQKLVETFSANEATPRVPTPVRPRRQATPAAQAALPQPVNVVEVPLPAADVEAEKAQSPAPRQSPIARESQLLKKALAKLRRERDPRAALALLDAYQAEFPSGELAVEAAAARVDALLLLGRRAEALKLLARFPLERSGRKTELLLVRAELYGERDCQKALVDFNALLATGLAPSLDERALYGRAGCRLRLGDSAGGKKDLERYLQRYPSGRFAKQVQAHLATQR